jgi:hypothetical protein
MGELSMTVPNLLRLLRENESDEDWIRYIDHLLTIHDHNMSIRDNMLVCDGVPDMSLLTATADDIKAFLSSCDQQSCNEFRWSDHTSIVKRQLLRRFASSMHDDVDEANELYDNICTYLSLRIIAPSDIQIQDGSIVSINMPAEFTWKPYVALPITQFPITTRCRK